MGGATAVRAALGLGANTGDRAAALAGAVAALDARADTRVLAAATPIETAPVGGPAGQPPFLNGAVTVETSLDAPALASVGHRLEHAAGRRRSDPWAPRPLDVDLLLHGATVCDTFTLRVPHPRLAGRPFVLEPLATIAGDWPIPPDGRTVNAWLAEHRARTAATRGAPELLEGIAALRTWRAAQAGSVGFVPTMGALHAGHRALMDVARTECDRVVVSIYVNPLQFGPTEDFGAYPRTLDADRALCAEAGVDACVVFADAEMYAAGHATQVVVGEVTAPLEGAHRPGHFDGVTTVVAKLFHLVQPDRAYFGQKDAQQCAVIRRMVRDLNWPLSIEVLPTVREADGLALSSRNAYLTSAERTQARALSAALRDIAGAVADGDRDGARLQQRLEQVLRAAPGLELDYAAIVDPERFDPVARIGAAAIACVAARVGRARLIDNVVCWPPPAEEA